MVLECAHKSLKKLQPKQQKAILCLITHEIRNTALNFIVNPLKLLYTLKGDFGRRRNDQEGLKALKFDHKN